MNPRLGVDISFKKTNVKQLIHHVAICNNILSSFCASLAYFFFAPYLPLPLINCQFTRNEQHHPEDSPLWLLTTRSEYDRLGRLHRRDVFTGNAQRPSPRRWSRRWDYDYRNNLVREERAETLSTRTIAPATTRSG